MFVVFTSRHRDFVDIEEISHTHLPTRFTGERSKAIYEHIRESFAKACKDDELPWCVQGFGSDGDSGRYKVQHIRTPCTYALTSQAMGVLIQFGEGLMKACGLCEACVKIFKNAMNKGVSTGVRFYIFIRRKNFSKRTRNDDDIDDFRRFFDFIF